MVKLNVKRDTIYTHEGAKATHINTEQQLRRSVMACLLWEKQFYEDGIEIAERISDLAKQVGCLRLADLAIEARGKMKLRHVPLLLVRELARHPEPIPAPVAQTLEQVIQRPDELAEFLAIYWKDGKQPLSAQVKKGLARAFTKFDEYQLAKYNRGDQIKLRDVMFLVHPKPKDSEQAAIWKRLADEKLNPPDTWEVSLSAGKDKKETWERLLKENKLGGLALLRNLRNMKQVDVNEQLVFGGLASMKTTRILPFRFIAAARYAPEWEPQIEAVMLRSLASQKKLPGKTVLLVDVSGSMNASLSSKSEMLRLDAAYGLAILLREICDSVSIYSFSEDCKLIPPRRGFALRDTIDQSQEHGGTLLGQAVDTIHNSLDYDRMIVITDEQAHDYLPAPKGKGYVINVASYENGLGYGSWTHIDGFSEAVVNWIQEFEGLNGEV